MAETPYITILNNNSQIKKSKAKNMKYKVRIKKTHTFFLKIEVELMNKWRFFKSDSVSLKEVNTGKTMNSHKISRENSKRF